MSYIVCFCLLVFFVKQKTAYEMRISDWSSDVCSSDLFFHHQAERVGDPGCEQVRALLDQRVEFGEEVGHIKCPKSVRIERSRDAPRPCAVLMGVSTSLDTNGKRGSPPQLFHRDRKSTRLNSSH